MKHSLLNRFVWWSSIYLIRAGGLVFLLSPLKLPGGQRQKLHNAAVKPEVLIVFNPGGWGDATLEQANDFTPILEGMQQTLIKRGYSTGLVQYSRALPDISGRCSGIREQIISFKHSSLMQAEDLRYLTQTFPRKRFILAGFSTGGGLTGRALKKLESESSIYGIMVGVPGWFPIHKSPRTVVLDNSCRDPVSCGNVMTIAATVLRAPYVWIKSRLHGRKLSLALALQIPDHEYTWASVEVRSPIVKFLENNFPDKPPRN
jgi:hypothetical protein